MPKRYPCGDCQERVWWDIQRAEVEPRLTGIVIYPQDHLTVVRQQQTLLPTTRGLRQPPWLLVQLHMLKQQTKRPAAAKTTTSPPGPQCQRQGKHSGDSVCPPGLQLMLVGSILPLFPLMYMLPYFSTAYPVHFNLQHQMQWQHLTETGWKAPIEV